MRYTIAAAAVLIVTVWLQINFLGAARPLGVLPNLLLITITYFALMRPASQTLAAALVGGLLLDFASGADFGLRMAFYSFYALAVVFLRQAGAASENLGSAAAIVALGTVGYNFAVLGSLILGRTQIPWLTVGRLIGLELLLNLLLTVVFHRLWMRLLRLPPEGVLAS